MTNHPEGINTESVSLCVGFMFVYYVTRFAVCVHARACVCSCACLRTEYQHTSTSKVRTLFWEMRKFWLVLIFKGVFEGQDLVLKFGVRFGSRLGSGGLDGMVRVSVRGWGIYDPDKSPHKDISTRTCV